MHSLCPPNLLDATILRRDNCRKTYVLTSCPAAQGRTRPPVNWDSKYNRKYHGSSQSLEDRARALNRPPSSNLTLGVSSKLFRCCIRQTACLLACLQGQTGEHIPRLCYSKVCCFHLFPKPT